MQNRKIEFSIKNIAYYLVGFTFIGLGVNLMKRANIGAGAWDTVSINLNENLTGLTLGTCSLMISVTLMLIVIAYRKKLRFLFMSIPLILVALSIDFWDIIVFGDIAPNGFLMQLVWYVAGLVIIPFSLALVITSKFPAFVFDEFMLMVMDIFKTEKVVYARLGIELFGILLGIILGFIAGVGFGAVGVGSVIGVFIFTPLLGLHLKLLGTKV
ncbi:MAG: hypothetical protein JXR62_03955 [Bacilli bacterium]|nr:hypothetical protein [Bacilli bacterium]